MSDNNNKPSELFDSEKKFDNNNSTNSDDNKNPLKSLGNGLMCIPTFLATKLRPFGMLRHSTIGKLLLMFASLYLIAVGSIYLYSGEVYPFNKDSLSFKSSSSGDIDPNQIYESGFDPQAARLAMINNPDNEQVFEWKDWMDLTEVQKLADAANKTNSIWGGWSNNDPFKNIEMPPKHAGSEEQQTIAGHYYLLARAPAPVKVILLGENRIVQTYSPDEMERRKQEKENLGAQDEMAGNMKDPEESMNEEEKKEKEKEDQENKEKRDKESDRDALFPELTSPDIADKIEVHTPLDSFIFNTSKIIDITPEMTKEQRDHAKRVKLALEHVKNSDKHFREVPLKNDRAGHGVHYDWRFFNMLRHGKDHEAFMHHLIRAWADFTNQENVLSLISHGSLIGWYWNGMAMPWDADNDVQMPIMELDRFARKFNQTLVVQDPKDGNGRYFVDVSPWYVERGRGNGRNVIDARFIDIRSGIYLDITGLAVTGSETDRVNCKNYHFYPITDVSPARRTIYEGVNVYVPNNYESVLLSEYKSARKSSYGSWMFSYDLRLWVQKDMCEKYKVRDKKFDKETNDLTFYGACESDEIWKEYNNTKEVTAAHFREKDLYSDLEHLQAIETDTTKKVDQEEKKKLNNRFKEILAPYYSKLRYDPK